MSTQLIYDSPKGDATYDAKRKEVTVFKDSTGATLVVGVSGKREALEVASYFLGEDNS